MVAELTTFYLGLLLYFPLMNKRGARSPAEQVSHLYCFAAVTDTDPLLPPSPCFPGPPCAPLFTRSLASFPPLLFYWQLLRAHKGMLEYGP